MARRPISSILFVCLGNICRSPLVEEVARRSLAEAGLAVTVDSCGTGDWHVGKGADPRMLVAARKAGYDLEPHRARQYRLADPDDFDLILAMDGSNLRAIRHLPTNAPAEMALFLPWSGVGAPAEFPDPYYGDADGFADAVALAEHGVAGLVRRLKRA